VGILFRVDDRRGSLRWLSKEVKAYEHRGSESSSPAETAVVFGGGLSDHSEPRGPLIRCQRPEQAHCRLLGAFGSWMVTKAIPRPGTGGCLAAEQQLVARVALLPPRLPAQLVCPSALYATQTKEKRLGAVSP
jgi:hypothetical protein